MPRQVGCGAFESNPGMMYPYHPVRSPELAPLHSHDFCTGGRSSEGKEPEGDLLGRDDARGSC